MASNAKLLGEPAPTIGRFAPSPTGHLHLGSLITAIASYCAAKTYAGQWLLRMEDTDMQRCRPEFATGILQDLERVGLHWDGMVRYQSQHLADYHAAIETLQQDFNRPLVYGCDCSRKQLTDYFTKKNIFKSNPPAPRPAFPQNLSADTAPTYPQLCLNKQLPIQSHTVRLQIPNCLMGFHDHLQGTQWANPHHTDGDIVLRRKDGMINYMLAAVVDDGLAGINQIVRGQDILPLTFAQLALAKYLKILPVSSYYHLPILVNNKGQKLSKQTLAEPISNYPAPKLVAVALQLLQQSSVPLDTPERMLTQAVAQWDDGKLKGVKQIIVPDKISDLLQH